ncbi:MAG: hypothetical protein R3A80_13865 [Bdellovibrionota bacterium]
MLAFSSNEMHGGTYIADVSVFAAGTESNFFNCKNSEKVNSSIQASGGLKLGMPKAEVESLYGKASKATKNYNLYRYDSKVKPNPQVLSDESNFCIDSEEILIHFKDEKVDWFALRHNEYC